VTSFGSSIDTPLKYYVVKNVVEKDGVNSYQHKTILYIESEMLSKGIWVYITRW